VLGFWFAETLNSELVALLGLSVIILTIHECLRFASEPGCVIV